jgi:hypothetical protein
MGGRHHDRPNAMVVAVVAVVVVVAVVASMK